MVINTSLNGQKMSQCSPVFILFCRVVLQCIKYRDVYSLPIDLGYITQLALLDRLREDMAEYCFQAKALRDLRAYSFTPLTCH